MSHNLVELVRGLRPEDAGRVDELFPPARRIELFKEIVSSDRPITAESGRRRLTPSRRTRWWPSMIRRVRRPVLISIARSGRRGGGCRGADRKLGCAATGGRGGVSRFAPAPMATSSRR